MAADTLGKLITEALMGLGYPPKELAEIEDAARAVTHTLALLKQHTGFSSQNLNLLKYEWTPASRTESLAGVPDLAIPAWVERQWSSNVDQDHNYWIDVRVANLAEIESSRLRGDWNRCAFHLENDEPWITFSYNPSDYTFRTHRLWYSPNVDLAAAFEDLALDNTLLPNFFPMVTGMAELELIATMRIRNAMKKDPNEALDKAWDKREEFLTVKLAKWDDRFKHFSQGERGNHKGARRRTILPRGMRI